MTPAAPVGIGAKCIKSTGGVSTASTTKKTRVTWSAAAHATGYTVWESKTSGSYSKVASVTTPSWSSTTLTAGLYLFELSTRIGTKWSSALSNASTTVKIKTNGRHCTG